MRIAGGPKTFAFVGAILALAFSASAARADDKPTVFWLEARPWTCADRVPELARELALACDAAGGTCRIASRESLASARVLLQCEEGQPMTAEGQTAAGTKTWSVVLAGDTGERLRTASMWALRGIGTEPPPRAEPEKETAVARAIVPHEEPAPVPKNEEHRFALELAARGTLAIDGAGIDGALAGGFRAAIAGRVVPNVDLGLAGTLSVMKEGDALIDLHRSTHNLFEPGVVIGWGAPFDPTTFGVHFEGGPSVRDGEVDAAFFRGMFTIQGSNPHLRPLASLTAGYFGGDRHGPMVGIDLGFAFGL